jgi:hypothetical protein
MAPSREIHRAAADGLDMVEQTDWYGWTSELVFAAPFPATLRAQFEEGRFLPVPVARASMEVLNRTARRRVARFRHEGESFVVKQERFLIPRVRYGGPFSGPNCEREFHNLRTLRANGIRAVEPLGYGVLRIGPFIGSSFLVTRDFTGSTDLRDWSPASSGACSAARLHELLLDFAGDLARLHRSRHYVWTLYAKNFLVRAAAAPDSSELALCDVPRLVHWPGRLSVAFAVRDLAALDKWAVTHFPREARLAFLETYLAALGEGPPLEEWCERIERRVDRLNHRTGWSSARKRVQRGVRRIVRARGSSAAGDRRDRAGHEGRRG